ncbi:MAG: alanine racemase [Candidatus Limnocylindrales bacterium]
MPTPADGPVGSIDDRLAASGFDPLPRPVWLEIDLDALANNVRVLRELIGPGVELSIAVKADAYGHGLNSVALGLESAGVDRLCVASVDEALALRKAGVLIPVLVLFAVPVSHLEAAAEARIEVSASSEVSAADLVSWARSADKASELAVHVEVETGLTRGGIMVNRVADVIARLRTAALNVRVAGMWTHMATPEDEAFTAGQVAAFDEAVESVRDAGVALPLRHLAATGGLLSGRVPAYEGVRIGLGAYGLVPPDLPMQERERGFADRLQPVMALKCHALRMERFPAGVRVSYGGRWKTERESVIATLPVGYGDAIPRPAPWGEALVKGQRVPLVGTVAMDAVMADVTDVADGLGAEDEFVLLGSQGSDEISAVELARSRNTIPWEVVTGMFYRIPRVYHAGSVLTGVRTLNSETRVSLTGGQQWEI